MALITGDSCLQLGMDEHLAAPEANAHLIPPAGGGPGDTVTAAGDMPEPEVGHYIAPGTGGHGRARTDGLLAVIQAFACRVGVFGYDATRHDKFLIMVAARPVLDALDLLLPSIAVQMEAAARTSARAYGEQVRPELADMRTRTARKASYFRSYLRGFGQGAAETIRAVRAEFIRTEGHDMLRVLAEQDVRAEEVYSREFPDTTALRKERPGHLGGFLSGQDAGRAVDLGDEYLAQHDLVFAMI
jgi:hypothetical protein